MDDCILKGGAQNSGFFVKEPEIFETIMQDDVQKIYQQLSTVQAPVRAKVIAFLEGIDEKYGTHIGDAEIAKVDAVLFTPDGREKYLDTQAFIIIDIFLNKKSHGIAQADKEAFETLVLESKKAVSSFLNQTKSVNNEPPLLHALIWCKFDVADVLRKEGAELTEEMIGKNIIWSMDKSLSINWLINAGVRVTKKDIQKAQDYKNDEIAKVLKAAYVRQTEAAQNPTTLPIANVQDKICKSGAVSNIAIGQGKVQGR